MCIIVFYITLMWCEICPCYCLTYLKRRGFTFFRSTQMDPSVIDLLSLIKFDCHIFLFSYRYVTRLSEWLLSSSKPFLHQFQLTFDLEVLCLQSKLHHLYCIQHYQHLPHRPSLYPYYLSWDPTKAYQFPLSNVSLWHLYLPHDHPDTYWCFRVYPLLFRYQQCSFQHSGGRILSLYFHSLWWGFLSIPYLCGTLLGCYSSHHLPQPEKWKRDHDQKYQHWLRLDAVSCIHCFNDGSRTGHYFEFFYWVFICNHHQLLQLFCSVYFDPSRPRGTGCT